MALKNQARIKQIIEANGKVKQMSADVQLV